MKDVILRRSCRASETRQCGRVRVLVQRPGEVYWLKLWRVSCNHNSSILEMPGPLAICYAEMKIWNGAGLRLREKLGILQTRLKEWDCLKPLEPKRGYYAVQIQTHSFGIWRLLWWIWVLFWYYCIVPLTLLEKVYLLRTILSWKSRTCFRFL